MARATGARLARACKLDKSYRTIMCAAPEACRRPGGRERKGKGEGGGLKQACLHLSQFSVAFFISHANAEAALSCVFAALDRHDKLRTAHS